ncbi:MAG: translation initiation factor IF-2 [Clostridiaceae bacterium]|nr:translation initiation factor IF-2 [Clostridiaceae bacterium]
MAKREDSGSGLRAGFTRADTSAPQNRKAGKKAEPKPDNEPVEKADEVVETPPPASEPEEHPNAPTITMQGVSGKKITGVVKVVKKAAKAETEETAPSIDAPVAESAAPERTTAPTEAGTEAPAKETAPMPSAPVTPAAPVADHPGETTAKPAVAAAPPAEAVKPASEAEKSDTAEPAPAPARTQERQGEFVSRPQGGQQGGYAPRPQGGQQGGYAPRPQGGQQGGYAPRPQGGQQGGYAPRPQGGQQGGYAPRPQGGQQGGYAPRPQGGQQGGYAPRPQGGQQGGYAPRPQGGQGGYAPRPQGGQQGGYAPRPQGGQGGYAPRPQGGQGGYAPRPQGGQGGYAPRPQGGQGGYAPRPQGGQGGYAPRRSTDSDVPAELIGRPQTGRGTLTARDGAAKPVRRDDSKDTRKTSARGAAAASDKHATLKKQAQILPDSGLTAALTDETIMETIYSPPPRSSRRRGSSRRRDRGSAQASQAAAARAILTHVALPENLTVKEFAEAIKKTSAEIIKKLMKMGVMATLNEVIDFDTATIIASEYNITTEQTVVVTEEDILFDETDDTDGDLIPRPPVVVVMGHVDHGKTSLLDRIRETSVAEGEAGGITQHIGAYMVTSKGRRITFLDTPGHEAFTTMRARGAQVTDIAILVVAADDGVMPQTVEAINHARAANTQIVVAINKIDLPGANIDRVKQELATRELIPEEWGGSTIMVPVSAKTGEGFDDLLEMLLLTADILDLKSNPDKQAKGTVIEAKLDKGRGPVATLLVQRGTLQAGDTLVTGSVVGRVRAMTDYKGTPIKKAGPSTPVEIIGLPEVPEAGELFYAVTDDKTARSLVERRRSEHREQGLRQSSRMSLESLYSKMSAGEVLDLNLIVKADVQGSVEAVKQSLEKLSTTEIRVNVIHGAVGAITEGDVTLAEVADAIIIGFNVRPASNVADIADEHGVDLRMYRIIYNAIEDVQAAMKGMLAPVYKESILGHAEVRQVFRITGAGTVAGCYVTDGRILRSAEVRVVRDGIVVHEGKLQSLKRFKDDVREVATGYECGIAIEKFNDIKESDIIEAFEMKEVERN